MSENTVLSEVKLLGTPPKASPAYPSSHTNHQPQFIADSYRIYITMVNRGNRGKQTILYMAGTSSGSERFKFDKFIKTIKVKGSKR